MSMSKETAWLDIVARLAAVAGIQKVYEVWVDPDSIPASHFPCYCIEPDNSSPIEDTNLYGGRGMAMCYENLRLIIWLWFRIFQKGKAVTGTGTARGVFDYELATKTALCALPLDLGDKATHVNFTDTRYLRSIDEQAKNGLIRGVEMEIEVPLLIQYR